ncbi:hypothetical protein ACFQL4_26045 [Halosimplex aquaticum]
MMVDLPEHPDEREQYIYGDLNFCNTACYEGMLIFTFIYEPAKYVRQSYQDAAFQLGRKVGIPVDPNVEELVEDPRIVKFLNYLVAYLGHILTIAHSPITRPIRID